MNAFKYPKKILLFKKQKIKNDLDVGNMYVVNHICVTITSLFFSLRFSFFKIVRNVFLWALDILTQSRTRFSLYKRLKPRKALLTYIHNTTVLYVNCFCNLKNSCVAMQEA